MCRCSWEGPLPPPPPPPSSVLPEDPITILDTDDDREEIVIEDDTEEEDQDAILFGPLIRARLLVIESPEDLYDLIDYFGFTSVGNVIKEMTSRDMRALNRRLRQQQ